MENLERVECLSKAISHLEKAIEELERYCEYPIVNNVLQSSLDVICDAKWAKKRIEDESL